MEGLTLWAKHHDSVKLAFFALLLIPIMLAAGAASETGFFWVAVLVGMAICGGMAYWLGNQKWLLIPLLAMLVFIALVVPIVMREPGGGETPFSIIMESPFWAGFPALIGAGAGYMVYHLTHLTSRRRN